MDEKLGDNASASVSGCAARSCTEDSRRADVLACPAQGGQGHQPGCQAYARDLQKEQVTDSFLPVQHAPSTSELMGMSLTACLAVHALLTRSYRLGTHVILQVLFLRKQFVGA